MRQSLFSQAIAAIAEVILVRISAEQVPAILAQGCSKISETGQLLLPLAVHATIWTAYLHIANTYSTTNGLAFLKYTRKIITRK